MENARNTLFPKTREIFEGFKPDQKPTHLISAAFRENCDPIRKTGLKWLDYLHEHRLGGCLADDMGLGKTIQVIALLSRIYPKENKPTLIVMPKSLLLNWRNELERFCPALTFQHPLWHRAGCGTNNRNLAHPHNLRNLAQ